MNLSLQSLGYFLTILISVLAFVGVLYEVWFRNTNSRSSKIGFPFVSGVIVFVFSVFGIYVQYRNDNENQMSIAKLEADIQVKTLEIQKLNSPRVLTKQQIIALKSQLGRSKPSPAVHIYVDHDNQEALGLAQALEKCFKESQWLVILKSDPNSVRSGIWIIQPNPQSDSVGHLHIHDAFNLAGINAETAIYEANKSEYNVIKIYVGRKYN